MQDNSSAKTKSRWALNSAMLPTVGIALLPKLFCPACWPAYAGLFSSLGIGFFNYTPWLMPLTSIFVAIALATLVWRARYRHGYKPFILGIVASIILLVGKFTYESDVAMYAGLVLLVSASFWNTFPVKNSPIPCSKCV